MTAPDTKTVKAGQLEVGINHDSGEFVAFAYLRGDRIKVMEGRMPKAVGADDAVHTAVHELAKAVMRAAFALSAPDDAKLTFSLKVKDNTPVPPLDPKCAWPFPIKGTQG